MMHPLEQLAPYVDGTLGRRERATVDEHLRSCARCRSEVEASARARTALRALPEAPVPDLASGFTPDRVTALREAPGRRPATPWPRVVPALAAAAVVALVALVAPRIGGGGEAERAADVGGAAATASEDAIRLEIAGVDYDPASLQQEAAATAGRLADLGSAAEGQVRAESSGAVTAPDARREAGPAASARARRCLQTAFTGHPGELVRIVRARFEGTPAYLGYVLEGPGAGQPPTLLSIWVAAAEDCSILSLSSAEL
jgi:hypothetical protein